MRRATAKAASGSEAGDSVPPHIVKSTAPSCGDLMRAPPRRPSSFAISFATKEMVQQPDITLTSFEQGGRADPTRLAFALGGITFQDERVPKQDWPGLKPKTPLGQLPMLTVNGEQYAQPGAVLRYAGRLAGLYPTTDELQALKTDMILDQLDDIQRTLAPALSEQDSSKKKELADDLLKTNLPELCAALDKILCKRGAEFAAGSSLTVADLAIYSTVAAFKSGRCRSRARRTG
jgi:glutathione S-transferase